MATPDTILLSQITRYVPLAVQRRLARAEGNIDEPQLELVDAALLFADVSGFTRLTELMAAKGSVGVEQLTTTLNDFFGVMIEHITQHGGDVIKFAGDAVISVFEPLHGAGLDDACQRAAACALAVQDALSGYRSAEGIELSVKTSVAAGKIAFAFLGGVWGRWELVLFGDPLADAGRAADGCVAGDVVLAACAARQLEGHADLEPREQGHAKLIALHHPLPPERMWPPELGDAARHAMWQYVPGAIRSRLRSGQAEWLAELRTVSVLFITMPGHAGDVSLQRSQELMVELQNLVYGVEGSVNKISADDKGLSLIAVLGMPPLAHEDDPRRAMVLAVGIRELMQRMGFPCSIGVTTGRAFCGVIGSDLRCEYTMIGDAVNLSARLMVASKGDILCDETTHEATRAFFEYDAVERLKLKGKAARIAAFRPGAMLESIAQLPSAPMVARRAELAELLGAATAVGDGQSSVIALRADAGMGKSTLVGEFIAGCDDTILLLAGAADSIERNTPYVAWRGVVRSLLGIGPDDDQSARRAAVTAAFASLPELVPLAPTLEAILPLGLSETPELAGLDGQARAFTLARVIIGLLQHKGATTRW